ncbi:MAG: DUF4268 domain-containing protein [Mycobacteriales bacterium]
MTTGPSLGRLALVPPREIWPHEAHDFTPWLLSNADVLSDLLGMDLDLEVAEHPVGGFSLDLLGRDTATGRVVIVENQLEVSDHTHLGQLLTYAAGTDPTTIVWVAPAFRSEHRAALDWLNTRTDENTRFFGVEIAVVRIGDSDPAPMFKLIAQPNDWEKTVRAATLSGEGLTEKEAQFQRFWTRWQDLVTSERQGWSRASVAPKGAWFSMTARTNGATYYGGFTRAGLVSQLWFEDRDASVNEGRLTALLEQQEVMEAAYTGVISFEAMPGKKATRMGEILDGASIAQEDRWDDYLAWLLDRQTRLRAAIDAAGGIPLVVTSD